MVDNLGNSLQKGKYYRLESGQVAQYIGLNDKKLNHLFQWKNPLGVKIVFSRLPHSIITNPPILVNNEDGYDTDTEYMDDPFQDDSDEEGGNDSDQEGGRKPRKNKTRNKSKTRKTRKNKTRNKSKKFD